VGNAKSGLSAGVAGRSHTPVPVKPARPVAWRRTRSVFWGINGWAENPTSYFKRGQMGLKKFAKAAGFGLNHVNEEFKSDDFLNELTAYCQLLGEPLILTFFIPSVSLFSLSQFDQGGVKWPNGL
jgi:hypothetical protein